MNSKQRKRLAQLLREQKKTPDKVWVGYWCSNAQGRSAYGHGDLTAEPGKVQRAKGELRICDAGGLHATRVPHQWAGVRVFVVALLGKRIDQENKSAASVREIVGEVFPEECIDPSVAIKCGVRVYLSGANLTGADLYGADLYGADLTRANLTGANLYGANLTRANLTRADLTRADLTRANLTRADLTRANLTGAYRSDNPPPGWVIRNGILVRRGT